MNFKQMIFRAALLIGAAALLSLSGCGMPGAQGSTDLTSRATTITSNQTGTDSSDSYYYSFWKQDNTGSVSMTINTGTAGQYTTSWSNCSNFTAGKGWATGTNNRVISYSGSFDGGSNGYLAVYGWMESPLIEYYILETWGSWDPTTASNLTYKGTVDSDGGSYKIYTSPRNNAPNITGTNQNFTQYWSIRTAKKTAPLSGTVTVANHFGKWSNLGMTLGTFASRDYQIVETEGYQSSGSSSIKVGTGTVTTKTWQTLGTGTNNDVYALVCNGSTVYAGGYFTSAGGKTAYRIAQCSGTTWSPVGSGTEFDATVNALAYNSSTSALFAGGIFTSPSPNFARYKSNSWGGYGGGTGGMDGAVNALAFTPGKLYVGGTFTNAGGVAVTNIAMWDGSKWNAVGSLGKTLPNGGFDPQVKALACDSSGTLYAAWTYYVPSGHGAYTVSTVSKWSSSAWTDIGTFNSGVGALACSGTTLYAGGGFTTVGSVTANAIAKYSGGTWTALGSGIGGGWVKALTCDSSGNLYVGGAFGTAGGVAANNIAEYTSGGSWLALGSGTNSAVNALAIDSSGALYAGGWFTSPGNYIAVYK